MEQAAQGKRKKIQAKATRLKGIGEAVGVDGGDAPAKMKDPKEEEEKRPCIPEEEKREAGAGDPSNPREGATVIVAAEGANHRRRREGTAGPKGKKAQPRGNGSEHAWRAEREAGGRQRWTLQDGRRKSHFVAQNYKTEVCRSHRQTGLCEYGKSCQFAHGIQELRPRHYGVKYKTQECRNYHAEGYCRFGSRCKFIHDESRVRVANDEFWLVSPSENLVRVEVVDNVERQRELAQLVSTRPAPPGVDLSAPVTSPAAAPHASPEQPQGPNAVGYTDSPETGFGHPPQYQHYAHSPETNVQHNPYAPYVVNGVLYGPPPPPYPPMHPGPHGGNGYFMPPPPMAYTNGGYSPAMSAGMPVPPGSRHGPQREGKSASVPASRRDYKSPRPKRTASSGTPASTDASNQASKVGVRKAAAIDAKAPSPPKDTLAPTPMPSAAIVTG